MNEILNYLRKLFKEAIDYLNKNDVVQSSEKFYKIAETVIKELARINRLDEYKKAEEFGRWTVSLLEKAVENLRKIYGEEIIEAWSIAYDELHIKGFHEGNLSPDIIRNHAKRIERMIYLLESELKI